jgi:hypothetical protein
MSVFREVCLCVWLLLAAGVFSGADVNTDVGAISVVNVLFTVPADLVSVRTTCALMVRVVGEIPLLPTLGIIC